MKIFIRQKRKIGNILEIDLGGEYYCYAQILKSGLVFFDLHSKGKLSSIDLLLEAKPLFFLEVYTDVITKKKWKQVGELPVRKEFSILPKQFIQDVLNLKHFQLYDPNNGQITEATREECEGLEAAAVWEAEHVESRLRDHYAGKPNVWVEDLKIK